VSFFLRALSSFYNEITKQLQRILTEIIAQDLLSTSSLIKENSLTKFGRNRVFFGNF